MYLPTDHTISDHEKSQYGEEQRTQESDIAYKLHYVEQLQQQRLQHQQVQQEVIQQGSQQAKSRSPLPQSPKQPCVHSAQQKNPQKQSSKLPRQPKQQVQQPNNNNHQQVVNITCGSALLSTGNKLVVC